MFDDDDKMVLRDLVFISRIRFIFFSRRGLGFDMENLYLMRRLKKCEYGLLGGVLIMLIGMLLVGLV